MLQYLSNLNFRIIISISSSHSVGDRPDQSEFFLFFCHFVFNIKRSQGMKEMTEAEAEEARKERESREM